MSVKTNLLALKEELKDPECTLVAISKTKPNEAIMEAYDCGQRDFGENKVQEMVEKQEALPKDIRWHMVGHLQRNKVKYMAEFVHLIHSVDSLKLLKEINKQAQKVDRKISCLLQVHIAEESSKFGFDENELLEALESEAFLGMEHVDIKGLMGMATFTDDEEKINREFAFLKRLFEKLKPKEIQGKVSMEILSMGMSGDYPLALAQGSNMIRVGSQIFGERNNP